MKYYSDFRVEGTVFHIMCQSDNFTENEMKKFFHEFAHKQRDYIPKDIDFLVYVKDANNRCIEITERYRKILDERGRNKCLVPVKNPNWIFLRQYEDSNIEFIDKIQFFDVDVYSEIISNYLEFDKIIQYKEHRIIEEKDGYALYEIKGISEKFLRYNCPSTGKLYFTPFDENNISDCLRILNNGINKDMFSVEC